MHQGPYYNASLDPVPKVFNWYSFQADLNSKLQQLQWCDNEYTYNYCVLVYQLLELGFK